MPWERCFGGATDGIRQERYIGINTRGNRGNVSKISLYTPSTYLPVYLLLHKVYMMYTEMCTDI